MHLGILTSHPIQYQAPWFRLLARRMDVEVLFSFRPDKRGQAEPDFGSTVKWGVPLLEGYSFRFLQNVARYPGLRSFHGCDNPELSSLIDLKRYDAVLVYGWNRKSCWQAMRACWRNGVPLLMRGDSQLLTRRSRFKRYLKYVPFRFFLRRIDGHLVVGRRNRDYLKHYGVSDKRLFFCPHAVDNEFFAARQSCANSIRHKFGIPEKAFLWIYVGKLLAGKKRPQDFLHACQELFPSAQNMHALIVGSGPDEDLLRKAGRGLEHRVHFAGFRNQSELPGFYHASNALVLPSTAEETWGLVVNEAMACGVPCVVSDQVGCAPDMIEEGKTGFVFRCGDIDNLVHSMSRQYACLAESSCIIDDALAAKISVYSLENAATCLQTALSVVPRKGRE